MRKLAAVCWIAASAWAAAAEAPFVTTPAGSAAAPRGFQAIYRFGWAALDAAEADFTISAERNIAFEGQVATTGVARRLFKLDATMTSLLEPTTLLPSRSRIVEKYRTETDTTELTFGEETVLRRRTEMPGKPKPSNKKFELSHATDLFGAVMNIRSQKWRAGDVYPLLVFSKASPYRATVTVEAREKITVPAGTFPAVRLSLKLKKVDRKGALLMAENFTSAAAWFSDDADRHLLKVKAEVMVGSVWAELAKVK